MKRAGSSIIIRFGQAVQRRRIELDLSQENLAERADLHRTYIADIERGVRNVSLRSFGKLGRALKVSIPDLYTTLLGDGQR